MESLKRWISFFIPGGILFFAALIMVHLQSFKPMIPTVVGLAPYLVFITAALIGLRFNRSSLVFSVLILAIADRALAIWVNDSPAMAPNAQIAYHAATFLLPVNLMILSFVKERGIFTYYGLMRAAFIVAQPIAVASFARLNSAVLLKYLTLHFIPVPYADRLALSQPALLAFCLACLFLAVRFEFTTGAKESGFFWAVLTLFASFLSAKQGSEILFYFCVAGFILLVSIIETSHAMAFRDELTGLPARRALKDDLLKLGHRYALAMVDIDHFKKFNDTYGHDVGDQVLRMVASKLDGVTGGGKAFRYGGEEFTIIFPGKYADNARIHLEEIRRAVEFTEFVIRRRFRPRKKPKKINAGRPPLKSVSVTISIGLAACDERHSKPQDVLKAADKALYRAKKQGRNRVCT